MTFTDDKGKQWKVVDSKVSLRKGDLIIRPVEEKKITTVSVEFYHKGTPSNGESELFSQRELRLTEDQAAILAESVSAMLDYIESVVDGGKTTTEKHNKFIQITKAAGKAHKELGPRK